MKSPVQRRALLLPPVLLISGQLALTHALRKASERATRKLRGRANPTRNDRLELFLELRR